MSATAVASAAAAAVNASAWRAATLSQHATAADLMCAQEGRSAAEVTDDSLKLLQPARGAKTTAGTTTKATVAGGGPTKKGLRALAEEGWGEAAADDPCTALDGRWALPAAAAGQGRCACVGVCSSSVWEGGEGGASACCGCD